MPLNRWWNADGEERYWLEITDRTDLGENLHAPQLDHADHEYWGYSLVREVEEGDVVFHYHRPAHAIVAWSSASGAAWADEIVWGAHGSVARSQGVDPYLRPSWKVSLRDFTPLSSPVTIGELRSLDAEIAGVQSKLEASYGEPIYKPFAVSDKRPLRPAQTYLTKLPKQVVDLIPALREAAREARRLQGPASGVPSVSASVAQVGTDYRDAEEDASVTSRVPLAHDPAEIERSVRGHAKTQNALAQFLKGQGLNARSPRGNPRYDLAWEKDGTLFVAEVKSLSETNEERQLRFGIGQVLRYRQLLASGGRKVVGVVASERKPKDESWISLCRDLGVILTWPEAFNEALGYGQEVP